MSDFLLILILLVPGLMWLANRMFRWRRLSGWALYLLTCLACYLLLLGSVVAYENELTAKLESLDTDRNGLFSGEEITPEVDALIDEATSDFGRRLAPITGVPISLIWVGAVFSVLRRLSGLLPGKQSFHPQFNALRRF